MTATLAPAAARAFPHPQAWVWRLQELLSAYLPLLLMAVLAGGTWWLVKSTPMDDESGLAAPPRHEPDYQMRNFELQRFGPDGQLRLRIEGSEMRHYPDTDTLEIDGIRLHAFGEKGGSTRATAQRATSNADASELQLSGGVQVQSIDPGAPATARPKLEVRGEFLRAQVHAERFSSHLPVQIFYGGGELKAQRFEYDKLRGKLNFGGRTSGQFTPPQSGNAGQGREEEMSSSSNKLVFVTGASSGIGQALALRYYRAGWNIALVARRTAELGAWAKAQDLAPERHAVYGADVSDIASITAAGRACIEAQGLPDVVIANAGISIGIDSAIFEDLAVMQQVYATNNIGLAATFQPFISLMNERGSGALVGIASVAGIRGLPGHAAYCSSKAAVISYCESLRGECRPYGVKVITIAPGYVATPLTSKNRYSMPFLMQPEAFADQAFEKIGAGVRFRVIPWQMGVVAKLLRALPDWLFDRVLAGRPRKHRAAE